MASRKEESPACELSQAGPSPLFVVAVRLIAIDLSDLRDVITVIEWARGEVVLVDAAARARFGIAQGLGGRAMLSRKLAMLVGIGFVLLGRIDDRGPTNRSGAVLDVGRCSGCVLTAVLIAGLCFVSSRGFVLRCAHVVRFSSS